MKQQQKKYDSRYLTLETRAKYDPRKRQHRNNNCPNLLPRHGFKAKNMESEVS
jgi:hypothetical protein